MNHFAKDSSVSDAAEQHQLEQDQISKACEDGDCDHADCSTNKPWHQRVDEIMDETRADTDDNKRRAARVMRAIYPEYDDDTLNTAVHDVLSDLRHLCDLMGWNFAEIDAASQKTYTREVVELGTAQDAELYAIVEDQL